jgi:hypothetical protein
MRVMTLMAYVFRSEAVINLPYNHIDDLYRCQPRPVRLGKVTPHCEMSSLPMESIFTEVKTANGKSIRLRLDTDSRHLAHFFSLNWPALAHATSVDATIVARHERARKYGLPDSFEDARWYYPETHQVWITGSEFYGNLKITIRGLCSELAPPDQMFLHGCAMLVGNRVLILSGSSGVGKTMLTAALLAARPGQVRVINDDWTPFSLATLKVQYTGETFLHMKYPTVRILAPGLCPTPASHPSENFSGDQSDPHARLMIARDEIFGLGGVASEGSTALFVVVTRNQEQPAIIRAISEVDVGFLEQGTYSNFYARTESFLNGSLFLNCSNRIAMQRDLHRRLLMAVPSVLVNNIGSPATMAELILDTLSRISHQPNTTVNSVREESF